MLLNCEMNVRRRCCYWKCKRLFPIFLPSVIITKYNPINGFGQDFIMSRVLFSYGLFECAYYAFDFRVKCMIIWEIGYVFVFICLTMEKSASYRDEVAVLVLLSGSVTLFNTCSVQRYISRSGFQFHHNYTPLNIHTIDATFSN